MIEKEYYYDSGIHINACQKCNSVFLDQNELEEIKAYAESSDRSVE
jgi:Zn-finger nucleic acid-binding protein